MVKTRSIRQLETLRAFGVMLGGSIALIAAAAASIGAVAHALPTRRRPPPLALLGTVAASP